MFLQILSVLAAAGSTCQDLEKMMIVQSLDRDLEVRQVLVRDAWHVGQVVDDKNIYQFGFYPTENKVIGKAVDILRKTPNFNEYSCLYENGSTSGEAVFYLLSVPRK